MKVSLDVEIFKEILQICHKVPRQEFEDLPPEHDILSFIRDLRNIRDISYLTDVNVNYLHKPWRAFATVIKKFLSGKETGMDKIRLLKKDAKNTNKMSYPRFTKIIIDYFMSKDQSIWRRNKMFLHTTQDDTMYTSMRCIPRHEKTQVYGAILPKELTNQTMSESEAYKTYYTFASGKKNLKPKCVVKKVNSNTSHKQKPVHANKGTKIKTKAKVMESKVPDEQQQKTSGTDKEIGTILGVPDVPIYTFECNKESWGDSDEEDDDENESKDDVDNNDDDSDENGELVDSTIRTIIKEEVNARLP
nr:hypothetical protein [Tanacetum cinerariifolium]